MNARTYPAPTITGLLCGLALAGLLFVGGCQSGEAAKVAPRTDPAAALAGGAQKEKAIGEAAREIVANPTDSVFVTATANRILDLIRLAPWSQTEAVVKSLVSERDAALAENATLRQQAAEADIKTNRIIRLSLAGAGAALAAAAIASFLLVAKVSAVFPGLGRDISIGLAALSALSWFASIAYGWAVAHQNWLVAGGAVIAVAVAALWYSNRRHESMRVTASGM